MLENPQIKIVSKDLKGQTFELSKDQHTIGRTEACDICIPNSAISSRHCILTKTDDGDYIISDLKSTNGVVVNSSRVDEESLHHSDIIRLGSVELIYESPRQTSKKKMEKASTSQKKVDLQSTAGVESITELTNFSPFQDRSTGIDQRLGSTTRAIGIGVIVGLAIVVAIALVVIVKSLL